MTTWLQHVKKVHAAGSTSFKESLKRASASWKKTKGSKADSSGDAKAAPKKKRRARAARKASIEQPAAAPKKKRRRAKKVMPKLSGKAFKSIDSINM